MPHVIINVREEQRLVKRLQEGDKTAAREFYSLYADRLAGVCSRYITDEEDLKDVFQNALVHIFSHIADFEYRGVGSLQAWTTRVMVNESLRFLRTKKQHEIVQLDNIAVDEIDDDDGAGIIYPDLTDSRFFLYHKDDEDDEDEYDDDDDEDDEDEDDEDDEDD